MGQRKRVKQPQSSPRRTPPQEPGHAIRTRHAVTGSAAAAAGCERTAARLACCGLFSYCFHYVWLSCPILHAFSRCRQI
jgi:hypothetical protein